MTDQRAPAKGDEVQITITGRVTREHTYGDTRGVSVYAAGNDYWVPLNRLSHHAGWQAGAIDLDAINVAVAPFLHPREDQP